MDCKDTFNCYWGYEKGAVGQKAKTYKEHTGCVFYRDRYASQKGTYCDRG